MLLTVYLLAASYINIQFLSNLIEKYVKADSAEHRINALWGKDAKLVKRVLLHRMVPGIWGARLRELQKMADDPNDPAAEWQASASQLGSARNGQFSVDSLLPL